MGILFVMWNIPYLAALIHPAHNQNALLEAVLMQAVGAIGETILLLMLPASHPVLSASIQRFVVFDSGGLICLLAALEWVRRTKSA